MQTSTICIIWHIEYSFELDPFKWNRDNLHEPAQIYTCTPYSAPLIRNPFKLILSLRFFFSVFLLLLFAILIILILTIGLIFTSTSAQTECKFISNVRLRFVKQQSFHRLKQSLHIQHLTYIKFKLELSSIGAFVREKSEQSQEHGVFHGIFEYANEINGQHKLVSNVIKICWWLRFATRNQ